MKPRIYFRCLACCWLFALIALVALPSRVSASAFAQEGNPSAQAQKHLRAGEEYFQSQKYLDALREFESARAIFHNLGDQMSEASAFRSIAQVNQHIGNLDAAIDAYMQSLAIWNALGQIELVASTHNAIGFSNLGVGELAEAQRHFLDSLKIVEPGKMPATRAEALLGLGILDLQENRLRTALFRFEIALSIWQELKQTENINHTLTYVADAVIAIAEDERARYQYKAALAYYERVVAIYHDLRDRPKEAWVLNEIGHIYNAQAEYEAARDTFSEVLRICREQKMRPCEINVLNNLGEAYDHLAQYQEALKQHQLAFELCQQESACIETKLALLYGIGRDYVNLERYSDAQDNLDATLKMAQGLSNREMEGQILTVLAELDARQAKYTSALSKQQSALAIFEEISYIEGQLTILGNMGSVYQEQGQLQNAEKQYLRALKLAHSIQDIEGEATAQGNLGSVYQELGRYEDALRACRLALAIWQKSAVLDSQGTIHNLMGAIYDDLGQYENALEQYNIALTIRRKSEGVSDEATTLNNIGVTYLHLRNYEQALPAFQEALTLAQALDLREIQRYALDNIGFTYARLGDYETALAMHQEALTLSRQVEAKISEGVSLHNIGAVHWELKQPQQALDNLLAALTIFSTTLHVDFQAQTLNDIGRFYQQQGELTTAIHYYKQALAVTDLIREKLKVEEFATSFTAERMTVYDRLIDALIAINEAEAAFEYSEQARARAFLDQIGNQELEFRYGAALDLIEEEQILRQQIIGLQNALNNERVKSSGDAHHSLIDNIEKELEAARQKHEQLIPQLKLTNPDYTALITIDTIKLEEIQSTIVDSETTLIEYYVMDEYTAAWIINREGVDFVKLNISRKKLKDQIHYLTNLIKEKDFDFDSADALYHALFAPLVPSIKHPNLIIIPHGVLHYLPFAALWNNKTQTYLIEDYAVTYAPSASALKLIYAKRNPNQNRLLAMGNPDKSLDRAEVEVQKIAQFFDSQVLTQTQASESQLYAQSSQIDLLHLAAHGIYDPYNALYTRIELAADATHDGNLEVHEIYGMDLSTINLVVLSACNTGLSEQSTGDELVGLTRAFLFAGSPAAITTFWSINDAASSVLMESFYHHLRSGMSNTEALRTAQREVLTQNKESSPYYWAAFALTGDYQGNIGQ